MRPLLRAMTKIMGTSINKFSAVEPAMKIWLKKSLKLRANKKLKNWKRKILKKGNHQLCYVEVRKSYLRPQSLFKWQKRNRMLFLRRLQIGKSEISTRSNPTVSALAACLYAMKVTTWMNFTQSWISDATAEILGFPKVVSWTTKKIMKILKMYITKHFMICIAIVICPTTKNWLMIKRSICFNASNAKTGITTLISFQRRRAHLLMTTSCWSVGIVSTYTVNEKRSWNTETTSILPSKDTLTTSKWWDTLCPSIFFNLLKTKIRRNQKSLRSKSYQNLKKALSWKQLKR